MENKQMKIVHVKVGDLKPAVYNPRKWSEKALSELKESIQDFGLVDPIIANGCPARKNIVIGGHFRLHVAKLLGFKVVPVVYLDIKDIKREKELNVRLNKNMGEWDWTLLASFDQDLLERIGFEEEEMKMMFNKNNIGSLDIPIDRLKIITIEPPEAPDLKEHLSFHCSSIEEYNDFKNIFGGEKRLRLAALLDKMK